MVLVQLRGSLSAAAVLVVALLACKQSGDAGSKCSGDGDCRNGFLCESGVCLEKVKVEAIRQAAAPPPPAAPPAAPASAAPPTVSASASAAPASSVAAAPLGPDAMFQGIGQRTAPPTTAEWDAVPKEISVRHSTPLHCETKFLREWLRVSCRGEAVQSLSVVRRDGVSAGEVLTFARPGSVASLVMPIRGSLEVLVAYRWSTFGTRTLTVRHAAGAPAPEIYFDAPP